MSGNNITEDVKIVSVPEEIKRRGERNVKRRKLTKILCELLIPAVILTVFFSVMLQADSLGVGSGNTDGAYGYVLSNIENIVEANPRIIDIAMLGAHDANMASLAPDNPIDGYANATVLGKIQPLIKGLQYRFAVTQTVSVGQLLLQGVRFLHFKYTNFDGEWLAAHTLTGRAFEEDVLETLQFLDTHKGEVLILLFHPSYFGEGASYDSFHDWLATIEYNGKNIYDYVFYDGANVFGDVDYDADSEDGSGRHIASLRYNEVTDNGNSAGVVLLDRREPKIVPDYSVPYSPYSAYFYDMDSNALHKWHNRMGSDVLIDAIDENCDELLAQNAQRDKLRVNQTQAALSAETFGDILRSIGAWSLLKFAQKHNVALLENPNFDKWLEAMPIFQVDFANSDCGDFNNRVVARIRDYNERLIAGLMAERMTV